MMRFETIDPKRAGCRDLSYVHARVIHLFFLCAQNRRISYAERVFPKFNTLIGTQNRLTFRRTWPRDSTSLAIARLTARKRLPYPAVKHRGNLISTAESRATMLDEARDREDPRGRIDVRRDPAVIPGF